MQGREDDSIRKLHLRFQLLLLPSTDTMGHFISTIRQVSVIYFLIELPTQNSFKLKTAHLNS